VLLTESSILLKIDFGPSTRSAEDLLRSSSHPLKRGRLRQRLGDGSPSDPTSAVIRIGSGSARMLFLRWSRSSLGGLGRSRELSVRRMGNPLPSPREASGPRPPKSPPPRQRQAPKKETPPSRTEKPSTRKRKAAPLLEESRRAAEANKERLRSTPKTPAPSTPQGRRQIMGPAEMTTEALSRLLAEREVAGPLAGMEIPAPGPPGIHPD
jgi:hypothetical protein